jgi:hypothetical protein
MSICRRAATFPGIWLARALPRGNLASIRLRDRWNIYSAARSYLDFPFNLRPEDMVFAGAELNTNPETPPMNKTSRTIIAAAAIAGLYAGSLALKASASTTNAGTAVAKAEEKAKDSCKGKDGCSGKDGKAHDCKGKNDCKGKGGCKTATNDCKGKNECKGKGGCSTAQKPADKPKTT